MTVAMVYASDIAAMRNTYPFDLVLLDLDPDDPGRNGQDIAFWMSRMARSRRPKVVIHSTNLRGSYAMLVTLKTRRFRGGGAAGLA